MQNIFNGFDYNPNDIDDEMFLSEVPLSLLKENIQNQFEDPSENRKTDFVQSFLNKYAYSKEIELEEDNDILDNLHNEFISFMEKIIKEYLGIGIPELDDMEDSEQEEVIHYIYRFFIMNIKKNFVKFIIHQIENNKETIYDSIPAKKEKDVGYLSFKKIIDDEQDVVIISNIFAAIDTVIHDTEYTIDDLFAGIDNDTLEYEYIVDAYDSGKINGNFMPYYVKLIDGSLITSIGCKVKNKLLKKYTNE